jgi:hypothetical protein
MLMPYHEPFGRVFSSVLYTINMPHDLTTDLKICSVDICAIPRALRGFSYRREAGIQSSGLFVCVVSFMCCSLTFTSIFRASERHLRWHDAHSVIHLTCLSCADARVVGVLALDFLVLAAVLCRATLRALCSGDQSPSMLPSCACSRLGVCI